MNTSRSSFKLKEPQSNKYKQLQQEIERNPAPFMRNVTEDVMASRLLYVHCHGGALSEKRPCANPTLVV
ncbi:uncharacterized [Tachysurus ichikawai]